ncbi:MAG: TonB-dependent receptor [Bacteroidales bacterium]|nr:TonB-dependent receptor [Bacteroidales bacterium]
MKKKCLLGALAAFLILPATAQESLQGESKERLDSAVVSASRAGKQTPVTYTMVYRDELQKALPSASLPMVLSLQPSVVTYNEGGTGLGNSAMTVRGIKGSQINVTLNGITLNDSESQEVFWVNIPALQGLVSTVQLQRGLGTTANGAGAFGASVNMNTGFVTPGPFCSVDFSAGSYNTLLSVYSMGTGLTDKGLYAMATYATGSTDGYIRNGYVQSHSCFVTVGSLKENHSIRFTYLLGNQRSGITWDGISLEQYRADRRQNDAGAYTDADGTLRYYSNQTDNYRQHHFQLNYAWRLSDRLLWTTTANYTLGEGYDEYLKRKTLSEYGIALPGKSNLVYQKRMDNSYAVLLSELRYRSNTLDITGGISSSRYEGNHFGLPLGYMCSDGSWIYLPSAEPWYRNHALKGELSGFVRAERKIGRMNLYGDIQYRRISLTMDGVDDDTMDMGYENTWNFLNPRAGVSYDISSAQNLYASISLGHREPGRSDIKENVKGVSDENPIRPEKMVDIELGWKYSEERLSASAGLYFMEYRDILLETGRLSTSGYAIKENVPRGYRRGIELAGLWKPYSWLQADANLTLSRNRISDYVSYIAVEDGETGETHAVSYGNTEMLLSPSVIGMMRVSFFPWRQTAIALSGKYVGKQYIDNTARSEMEIPSWFVTDLSASWSFPLPAGVLTLSGFVNNLFNHLYYAYGWRWESYSKATDTISSGVGVYPQPERNFTLKVSYRF